MSSGARIVRMLPLVGMLAVAYEPAYTAELQVLSAGIIEHRFAELVQEFEQKNGHRVSARFNPSGNVARWVEAGEPCDVVILASEKAMQGLIDKGSADASGRTTLAKAVIGVAVKENAPSVDLSSPESLKQAMLAAGSFAYTNPAAGSSSGAHVQTVIRDLGIAEDVRGKILMRDRGQATIRAVAEGLAEFVIAQSTEIAAVKGVRYVGPLPPSLQAENLVQAAACAHTKAPEAARTLLMFLTQPYAQKHWHELGFARR